MYGTELLQEIRNIIRLFETTDQPVCEKYGLTKLEVDILAFLNNNPSMNTAKDIVEYRMLPKASVSVAVESLIQKGLLTRRQDHADRRRVHLALTGAGKELVPDLLAARQAFVDALFSDFKENEKSTYREMLSRMAKNARTYLEGRTPHAG